MTVYKIKRKVAEDVAPYIGGRAHTSRWQIIAYVSYDSLAHDIVRNLEIESPHVTFKIVPMEITGSDNVEVEETKEANSEAGVDSVAAITD